jgi:predicted phage terminase large subunit-like protein
MEMNKTLLHAVLRTNLTSFVTKTFHTINPGMKYEPNWHIDLICDYLESVADGSIKRLIINIPPRSLKSVCISVAFPAWLLGLNPAKRIMCASYSNILSIKHSLDTRFVMNSSWYNDIFPNTILSNKHNQKTKFLTTKNGFRFATSVGGSATGEGGDMLIIDDPHNPSKINSSLIRKKTIEWFEQTFVTRLNDRSTGAIIIVMQRLHSHDLCGYLLENFNNWEHLKIPVIANQNYVYYVKNHQYNFYKDETLHKIRDKLDDLIKLEKDIGISNYHAQYMQEPISNNFALLKLENISFYEKLPRNFEYIVQSWDSAIKISESSDYSVCSTFGILDSKYYLISIYRAKLTYPQLKSQFEQLAKKYNPQIILIEDKASGQQLLQDVQISNNIRIIGIKPRMDKVTRFATIIHMFENASILLPKDTKQNINILNELLNFPYSKHDDIVDSISQFLNFIKNFIKTTEIRIRNL